MNDYYWTHPITRASELGYDTTLVDKTELFRYTIDNADCCCIKRFETCLVDEDLDYVIHEFFANMERAYE